VPNIVDLSISNYRGFYAKKLFRFAVPTGRAGSGLTILVGPNNSGKSTVVAALQLVIGREKPIDIEHRHPDAAFEIKVTNDSGQQKSITNPRLDAVTEFIGDRNSYPTTSNVRVVPSRRAWSAYTGSHQLDSGSYWNNVIENGAEQFVVSRIATLSAEQRSVFEGILKELLPDISSWKVELSRGQSYIEYTTKSGAKHAADLFGDGMASLFRLSLALVDSSDSEIIVIDEPELSLHPQAQKALAFLLSQFASSRQILITTHSPYFVNWGDLANGAKVYRLTQHSTGVEAGFLRPETLEKLHGLVDDWQKPNLLDAVSREVFFAEEVIFVEGQEDVGLIRKFCTDRKLPQLGIFGYGAGGYGNIRYFLAMARDLGIRAAALYDGDHSDVRDQAEEEFPEALIVLLPTPDIRDKPGRDANGRETDQIVKLGIFDRSGAVKTGWIFYLWSLLVDMRHHLRVN